MNRYTVQHPTITPEHYDFTPTKSTSRKIRALHIPVNAPTKPQIHYTSIRQLLDDTYGSYAYRCLHFDNWFHTYVSIFQGIVLYPTNIVATHLMRIHALMDTGETFPDSVYGDVIICGSAQSDDDPHDLSVPYEIIEQVFHVYEKIR